MLLCHALGLKFCVHVRRISAGVAVDALISGTNTPSFIWNTFVDWVGRKSGVTGVLSYNWELPAVHEKSVFGSIAIPNIAIERVT